MARDYKPSSRNPRRLTGGLGVASGQASWRRLHILRGWVPVLAVALAVLAAMPGLSCSETPATNDPLQQPPGGPPVSLVVANTDLAVGENRVTFGLVDREYMPVRPESVDIRAVYYEPGAPTGQVRYRTTAEFVEWPPAGRRGTFVARVEFDQAGTATGDSLGIWELHATFDHLPEGQLTIGSAVPVAADHSAPAPGDPAPPSETPTAFTATDLRTISSSPEPDPALYQVSVAEAVRSGKPTVITFATPAFCVSATCGPQVSELSSLARAYAGQANFVHVEVYRDPHLIDPASPSRNLAPAVEEWGLVSEPWTFVVGADGNINARFEQYVPPAILESAILSVVQP